MSNNPISFKNIRSFTNSLLQDFDEEDSFKEFAQDMMDLASTRQWNLSYTDTESPNKYLGFSLFKDNKLLFRYNVKKDDIDNRCPDVAKTSRFREVTREHRQMLLNLFKHIHNGGDVGAGLSNDLKR